MIFKRSLIRELTITVAGLFTVSLVILFTNQIVRLLGRAVGGRLVTEGILPMLGFLALQYLHILLASTLFLAVLLTLTRTYRDSEMVVWTSSGLPLTAWISPIMTFAAPFLVAVFALSLLLTPWALGQRQQYEQQLQAQDEITMLAPGLFREFKRAGWVFYVDSINPITGSVSNVFVQSIDKERPETLSARSAHLDKRPDGERFLVAEHGTLYVGSPDSADYQIIDFSQVGIRIEPAEVELVKPSIRAMNTPALVAGFANNPAQRAELFWRLSVPIMALMLTLLAIPLSYVNPRLGRSFNLIAAVLVYLLYSNSLNILMGLIAHDKMPFWLGLILPHGTAILIVWLLFVHRTEVQGLRGLRRSKTMSKAGGAGS